MATFLRRYAAKTPEHLIRLRKTFEYRGDDRIRVDAFGFALEIQEHAMTQGAQRDGADVFARDIDAVAQQGADFAADDHRLRGARTGATAHIAFRQRMRLGHV